MDINQKFYDDVIITMMEMNDRLVALEEMAAEHVAEHESAIDAFEEGFAAGEKRAINDRIDFLNFFNTLRFIAEKHTDRLDALEAEQKKTVIHCKPGIDLKHWVETGERLPEAIKPAPEVEQPLTEGEILLDVFEKTKDIKDHIWFIKGILAAPYIKKETKIKWQEMVDSGEIA
ncbi:hypothetical protein FHY39_19520 [Salmonella enterica]|nr:hypothetical protein [Salmonella enterica]